MRILFLSLTLFGCTAGAVAQQPATSNDVKKAAAPAGSNWDHLKALPAHAHLHVSSDKLSKTCHLLVVDDDALTCSKSSVGAKADYTFPRAEVKLVKLTHYGRSTLAGAGSGASFGLVAGLATTQDKNGWFNGPIRGVMTLVGAAMGAAVAGPTDAFRGSAVYRRP